MLLVEAVKDPTLSGEFPAACPRSGEVISVNGHQYMICRRDGASAICRCVDGRWKPLDEEACAQMAALAKPPQPK
jgi:hypothetical protein